MSTYSAQRPSPFEGQYLGAEDFTTLIDYFRTQDARQILGQHSWGIAMGLDLVEQQATDGTLDVFVQPGLAFDGYGRLIVVLNRHKLDSSRFADSGEVPIWIRYDEAKTQGVRKGFEVCSSSDNFSRVNENFAIEVGFKSSVIERNGGIVLNGSELIDPREALRAVDDQAPLVCDGSVPHQDMTQQEENRRWLVPLGLVHWHGASGSFQSLSDEQRIRSRRQRRYVGNIAESIYAAHGIIRLRERHTPFEAGKSNDELCELGELQGPDFHLCKQQMLARELVWLEGDVRVTGDCRLFGSRLEFRDDKGRDYIARTSEGNSVEASIPLLMQRKDNATNKSSDLQILIGASDDGRNRLSIGHTTVDTSAGSELCDVTLTSADHVVIQDDGKTGIGAVDSTLVSPLTLRGIDAEGELLSFEDNGGSRIWHWNLGENRNSVNLVETSSDASRFFVEAGGKLGFGTSSPTTHLHIKGDDPDLFLDLNDSSVNSLAELRLGKDGAVHSSFFWSKANNKTYIANEGTHSIVIDEQHVGLGTDSPLTTLHLATGSDVTASDSSGYLVIGSDGGANLGFDNNEIQARNNDNVSTLHLQNEGGDLAVHPSGSSRVVMKASGNVGIGTNSPGAKLDLASVGSGTWLRAGDGGDSGRFWVEYGSQSAPLMVLSDFDNPPRIRFQQTGSGSETAPQHPSWIGHAGNNSSNLAIVGGDLAVGHQNPQCRLHVQDSISGDANDISSHVACIDNTSSGSSPDVLALKVNRNNPSSSSNFVTFFDSNSAVGRIEGNSTGGVVYRTTGADFAECLSLRDPALQLKPGDVVGINGGRISHNTEDAEQVLVITDSAAVVANSLDDEATRQSTVAFIGQVRVRVLGPVRCGDLLLPSGREDGTAIALSGQALQPNQLCRIIGQAWEASEQTDEKRINCAISMLAGLGGGLGHLLNEQQQRLERLEQGMTDVLRRLDG